ncbi:MAG: hypothetical protein V3T02_05265 [Alphaproteobacteria bacterium]
MPSADEINRILEQYISMAMEGWGVHAAGGGWKSVQMCESQIEALDTQRRKLADGLRLHDDTSSVELLAGALIKQHGLPIKGGTEAYRCFCRRVVDAELEVLKLKKARLEEFYGPM